MQESSVNAQVVLADLHKTSLSVDVYEMSGHSLDDENTFESPERVLPKQKEFCTESCSFQYDFPKHSITVFRVK